MNKKLKKIMEKFDKIEEFFLPMMIPPITPVAGTGYVEPKEDEEKHPEHDESGCNEKEVEEK